MFEILKLGEDLVNILSLYFKGMESESYIKDFNPFGNKQASAKSNFSKGFSNEKWAVWREDYFENEVLAIQSPITNTPIP